MFKAKLFLFPLRAGLIAFSYCDYLRFVHTVWLVEKSDCSRSYVQWNKEQCNLEYGCRLHFAKSDKQVYQIYTKHAHHCNPR